ncbi:MAG: AraC family transcriptional regulator [Deinococcales bacterium]
MAQFHPNHLSDHSFDAPRYQSDYTRLWRPEGFKGVELFDAAISKRYFPKHLHNNYTICLTYEGVGEIWSQRGLIRLYPGSLSLINPEEVHAGGAYKGDFWRYRVIYLDRELVEKFLPEGLVFEETLLENGPLNSSFEKCFRQLAEDRHTLAVDEALVKLLEALKPVSDSTPKPSKELSTIAKARDYLRENYFDSISVSELAKNVGLSANYLIRAFRKAVGLPPHAYQMQLRIEEARQALKSSKPIAQVALDAGFFDQSHFARLFKRFFGVTPQQYRQGMS